MGTEIRNRFKVLEDEMEGECCLTHVGDSLVRHLDVEVCNKNKNRRRLCYPGAELEDLTVKVHVIVRDVAEDSVVVIQAETINVARGRSEETLGKYRKLQDSRGKVVVAGLLPKYDAGSEIFIRMLDICSRVQGVCRIEDVDHLDLWDCFSSDMRLFAKDGFHINRVHVKAGFLRTRFADI